MRVIIVDDDPMVSMSLKIILENEPDVEVVATGSNGFEAIELVNANTPDVLVMDIRMDGMNGLDAAEKLLETNPSLKILFLTTFLDDEYINKALKVGALGYVLKQDCASIGNAVKAVYEGQAVFGGKIVERLPNLMNRTTGFNWAEYDITPKEQQVVELVADGLSNKEIAAKLFLGEGTVRNMISSVLSKLDLRDRTQLACFYYQRIKT